MLLARCCSPAGTVLNQLYHEDEDRSPPRWSLLAVDEAEKYTKTTSDDEMVRVMVLYLIFWWTTIVHDKSRLAVHEQRQMSMVVHECSWWFMSYVHGKEYTRTLYCLQRLRGRAKE